MVQLKRMALIFILILLLNISFAQPLHADTPKNSDQMATIWMPRITEDNYFTQITITTEQIQTFYYELYDIFDSINISMAKTSPSGNEITQEEWIFIKENISNFVISIKSIDENFPNINIEQIITDVIEGFFNPFVGFLPPRPIISIGTGATWIPLYQYESFIGFMLRPMLTRFVFGFSKVGGLLSTYWKLGTYFEMILGFKGLFINFGNIGYDQVIGPTIYIGRALYVRT